MRGVFGLDQQIASLASGTPAVALAVALLLGLRHPLDPDHLAAVGAMSRSSRGRSALVGLSWGVGHATTIVLLGAPVVLWAAALPLGVHRGIEALIGVAILALGVRLSVRGAASRMCTGTPGRGACARHTRSAYCMERAAAPASAC